MRNKNASCWRVHLGSAWTRAGRKEVLGLWTEQTEGRGNGRR